MKFRLLVHLDLPVGFGNTVEASQLENWVLESFADFGSKFATDGGRSLSDCRVQLVPTIQPPRPGGTLSVRFGAAKSEPRARRQNAPFWDLTPLHLVFVLGAGMFSGFLLCILLKAWLS